MDIYVDNLRMNKNESSDIPNYLRKETHQCCLGGPTGPDTSLLDAKRPKMKDPRSRQPDSEDEK